MFRSLSIHFWYLRLSILFVFTVTRLVFVLCYPSLKFISAVRLSRLQYFVSRIFSSASDRADLPRWKGLCTFWKLRSRRALLRVKYYVNWRTANIWESAVPEFFIRFYLHLFQFSSIIVCFLSSSWNALGLFFLHSPVLLRHLEVCDWWCTTSRKASSWNLSPVFMARNFVDEYKSRDSAP